jgi:hypothetical protein
MKTIKAVLCVLILLVGIGVNAQEKKATFGVRAGLAMSNMTDDLKGDAKFGFTGGITFDYAFTPDIYLLTGLHYSMDGTKDDGLKVNMSYLKLPLHAGYKMAIRDQMKMVFHGGPYLAYAVDGNYKSGGVSIDAFDDEIASMMGYKMKRFDFGLGLGIGLEVNKFCFNLGWDYGLLNMLDLRDPARIEDITGIRVDKMNAKTQNAYLTVGYKF